MRRVWYACAASLVFLAACAIQEPRPGYLSITLGPGLRQTLEGKGAPSFTSALPTWSKTIPPKLFFCYKDGSLIERFLPDSGSIELPAGDNVRIEFLGFCEWSQSIDSRPFATAYAGHTLVTIESGKTTQATIKLEAAELIPASPDRDKNTVSFSPGGQEAIIIMSSGYRFMYDRYGRILINHTANGGQALRLASFSGKHNAPPLTEVRDIFDGSSSSGAALASDIGYLYTIGMPGPLKAWELAKLGDTGYTGQNLSPPFSAITIKDNGNNPPCGAADELGFVYVTASRPNSDPRKPDLPVLAKLRVDMSDNSYTVVHQVDYSDLTIESFRVSDMICDGVSLYLMCWRKMEIGSPVPRQTYYQGKILKINTADLSMNREYGLSPVYTEPTSPTDPAYWNSHFYGQLHILGFTSEPDQGRSDGRCLYKVLSLVDEGYFQPNVLPASGKSQVRFISFNLNSFAIVQPHEPGPTPSPGPVLPLALSASVPTLLGNKP